MISFSIQNFGCRVNQAEAFFWADELQERGLKLEENYSESDLVLVNSCTLTGRTDRDVVQFIKKISRTNPKARVIITGCLVELAYDELKDMPQVWQLFRNEEKNDLVLKVLSLISSKEKAIPQRVPFRSRALLKIQDGCNFRCAFCIIPHVRGKSVSFPRDEILSRVMKLISQGFREIVLTGIHLLSYGKDLIPRTTFLELLQEIENVEGLGRIRLSSLDPRFLTHTLLEQITSGKKVCPHFHLSLQHGSDDVLEQMGRRIKAADYKKIFTYLHQHSPQASIGADILVGFPGESEKDFEQMFTFLEQSPLTYLHVFPFSPRPGTSASSWPQVGENVKKKRAHRLRRLSQQKNLSFRRHFLGRTLDGIVVRNKGDGAEVLTSNYIKVRVPYYPLEERKEVRIRLEKVSLKETIGTALE